MITAITNARVVCPDGLINGTILMENGRLLAVGRVLPPEDAVIHDAHGQYVGPGFIDIHCHGGGRARGYEKPKEAAAYHLAHGTTSLLLSLAYSLTKSNGLRASQ
jgi:N-acetylglucosamine-6-phosphate deacetylase